MWDVLTWHDGTLAVAWWFMLVVLLLLLCFIGFLGRR